MPNNENEGYGGAIIDTVRRLSTPTLSQHPNLVLLMAGVNDINTNTDTPDAPARLKAFVEDIFAKVEGVTVVVALLTPYKDHQEVVDTLNSGIEVWVNDLIKGGQKVVLVRMEDYLSLPDDFLPDGLHPNDEGYEGMARAWLGGVEGAEKMGWILTPGV